MNSEEKKKEIVAQAFGRSIRDIRQFKYHSTLEEFSELTDLEANNLSKIERGEQLPSFDTLFKLYQLDISIDKLLDNVIKELVALNDDES